MSATRLRDNSYKAGIRASFAIVGPVWMGFGYWRGYAIFSRCEKVLRAGIPALVPFAAPLEKSGRVAQLAEHSALNRQVEGSIPSASTK